MTVKPPLRKTTAAARKTAAQARHRAPVFAPWVLAAAVLGMGVAAHRAWADRLTRASLVAVALVEIGALSLVWLGWLYAHGRKHHQRVHVVVTTAAAGSSVLLTLMLGWHRPWADLAVGGATLLCLSWNIRHIQALHGDGSDEHEDSDRLGWDEALNLPKSTAKIVKHEGPRAEVAIRLAGGKTVEDAQRQAGRIASFGSLPPTGVRIFPDPDHADRAVMVIVTEDVLRGTLDWPGPSRPGGSIADPIAVGLYEDGTTEEVFLPGNWTPDRKRGVQPRNAAHLLLMGMSGAGKTGTALIAAAEILTRRDVVLWWCDVVKGMQSARPIAGGIDWLVADPAQAKGFLSAVQRVIRYRAGFLGAAGYREWWPGCGIPYLVVWLEEAASVVPDSATFVRLTEQARSVGISIVASLQRASHDNFPTSARANMGASLCFGTESEMDSTFALAPETLDAGAKPHIWKAGKPGYHYAEYPHTGPEQWATIARAFYEEDGPLAAAVAAGAAYRTVLDAGSAAAAGELYSGRASSGAAVPAPVAKPAAPAAVPDDDDDDDAIAGYDDEDEDGDDDDMPDEPTPIPVGPNPEEAGKMNPRDPIAPWEGAEWNIAPDDAQTVPLTRAEKEARFSELLSGLVDRGRFEVRMGELVDAWYGLTGQAPNRSRPFLHEMLKDEIDAGRMERDMRGRGVYRIVRSDAQARR